VEKLVPGGDGLARHEGKVVFVPGALPGEKVRVRLRESRKDFARAEIEAVLAPSPERIAAPCPVAGRCGGCEWQHIAYPEQLRQKVSMVQDALRRVGGIIRPDPAIEAGNPWGYRSRARLQAAPGGRLGFLARGSHEVVPIETCPVAHPALDALIRAGVPGEIAKRDAGGSLMAWGHGSTSALAPLASGPRGGRRDEGDPDSESPALSTPAQGPGSEVLRAGILGKAIEFDLRCFFQSNVGLLEKLIPFALDGLSGSTAMDLYCGVGLFGAFLADRFDRILAVESNPASLDFARRNIPGTGHRFLEGRLEDLAAQGRLGEETPDAVVVDPPRAGLDGEVREWLRDARPPKLVYVSCNPVTLARDLKDLAAAGFVLKDLRLFDFYPQTAHIESVARLDYPR
jgi:23S rRNA (uracil1939-C5)-methyltransferase